tara:strand:+ start:149 stop:727 length:579 start_codon:yes stop_codon:yes gene_type:complete
MEIIENILNNEYISNKTKKNLTVKISKLSKKCRILSYQKLKEYYISKNFDKYIISMLGGMENMINFPILKWNDKFIGSTDYIDNIMPQDLSSKIMIGIDNYNRAFISLRTNKNGKRNVDTLFQRYTNEKNTWTNGTNGRSQLITEGGHFYIRGKIKHKHIEQNIENLLESKGYIFLPSFLSGDIQKRNLLLE